MRKLFLVTIAIFSCCQIKGQNSLTGVVLDSLTNEPIPYANVFFANTSIGSVTNDKGLFSIRNFPSGKYDVTVSFVGYNAVQQPIIFSESEKVINVYLAQQSIQLREILVREDTMGWKRNFMEFKKLFLGETQNASKSTIINNRALRLFFDPTDRLLVAFGKQPIEIENTALGYKVFCELEHFQFDYKQGRLTYYGIPRFEVLQPKRKGVIKQWERERQRAYEGSFVHFLKSLKQNQLEKNGFDVHYLFRVTNYNRPSDDYLNNRIKFWREKLIPNEGSKVIIDNSGKFDSLRYYLQLRDKPKIMDSVGQKIIDTRELFAPGDPDLFIYKGLLRVMFNESEENSYAVGRQPLKVQRSVVQFLEKNLRIFDNGYYEDVKSVTLEGYMGWSEKVAELLPLEYTPSKVNSGFNSSKRQQ